jgi:hypothetical protein
LEDDACIHLYPSVEAIVYQIEALGAEGCLRAVFDEYGQRYRIEWIKPNREGWGLENGRYTLVPDGRRELQALFKFIRQNSVLPGDEEWVRQLERELELRIVGRLR